MSFVHAKCSYHEQRRLWLDLECLLGSVVPGVVLGNFNVFETGNTLVVNHEL